MVRVTFGGVELRGFQVELPAASVRLLLPAPGTDALVIPAWNGNEFLLPDGSRPALRTFTPRRVDADALELDLDMVLHGRGVMSEWAERAKPGDEAAVSGPGRGYTIDLDAPAFFLAGDESAIPAMSQLLEVLPSHAPVAIHIEITQDDAKLELPEHANTSIEWHRLPDGDRPGDTLLDATRRAPWVDGTKVWVAGEAAGVQRIRKFLFEERGLPRTQCTIRGYWKIGRGGDADD